MWCGAHAEKFIENKLHSVFPLEGLIDLIDWFTRNNIRTWIWCVDISIDRVGMPQFHEQYIAGMGSFAFPIFALQMRAVSHLISYPRLALHLLHPFHTLANAKLYIVVFYQIWKYQINIDCVCVCVV